MKQAKRDKLSEYNRSNIIEAAKTLFETKGISQTTMDDIAAQAVCSKSTIYVYFSSKDEIYHTIVHDSMVLLKDIFEEIADRDTPFPDKYYAICNALVDFQQRYPLYFSSILGRISVEEQDFEQYPILRETYEVGEEINDILSMVFTSGKNTGYIRNDIEPITTIFLLWASLGGIIQMAEQKERYFQDKLNISRRQFLDNSFAFLLSALEVCLV